MPSPARRTNEELLAPGAGLLCSIPEAAQVLGVDDRSVRKLLDDGSLHQTMVGRRRKVGLPSLRKLAGEAASLEAA